MAKTSRKEYQVGAGTAFLYSLIFHGVIIVLGIVGLPHIKKELHAPQPISVEIAMIDEVIKTTKPPKEIKKPEPKEETKPKPVETPRQALQQPTNTPPKKEPEKIEKPVEKKVPPPPKESILKKPEIKKPKPPEKKERPKEEKESKKEINTEAFASVLKNLAPIEEASKPETTQQGEVAQTITADELSAVRQQFANCWNLLPGARDADKLAVELRIKVYPDRTLNSVEIVDKARYSRDTFYRAAADNAVRAVRNPACNPLKLPPNKYDLWKDIIFNFDPRGMF